MFKEIFENIKSNSPLVHNITNYVTVNDCANILLACGCSPIMADDINEVSEITAVCSGLNINMGTLNENRVKSMLEAGKTSNNLDHPVLLDPVGIGASTFRINSAKKLLENIHFSVIRGNISEIKILAEKQGDIKGVDASKFDKVTEENLDYVISFAKEFSQKLNSIIVITGALDIITDGKKVFIVKNGHSFMSKISGTGCQLSALITGFISANKNHILEATLAAVCTMGIAGELAYKRLSARDGNMTYKNYIIDEICHLTSYDIEKGANYEMR